MARICALSVKFNYMTENDQGGKLFFLNREVAKKHERLNETVAENVEQMKPGTPNGLHINAVRAEMYGKGGEFFREVSFLFDPDSGKINRFLRTSDSFSPFETRTQMAGVFVLRENLTYGAPGEPMHRLVPNEGTYRIHHIEKSLALQPEQELPVSNDAWEVLRASVDAYNKQYGFTVPEAESQEQ